MANNWSNCEMDTEDDIWNYSLFYYSCGLNQLRTDIYVCVGSCSGDRVNQFELNNTEIDNFVVGLEARLYVSNLNKTGHLKLRNVILINIDFSQFYFLLALLSLHSEAFLCITSLSSQQTINYPTVTHPRVFSRLWCFKVMCLSLYLAISSSSSSLNGKPLNVKLPRN